MPTAVAIPAASTIDDHPGGGPREHARARCADSGGACREARAAAAGLSEEAVLAAVAVAPTAAIPLARGRAPRSLESGGQQDGDSAWRGRAGRMAGAGGRTDVCETSWLVIARYIFDTKCLSHDVLLA